MRILLLAVLCCLTSTAIAEPTRVLLIGDEPDGHPWNTHEFRAGVRILESLLSDVPNLEVTVADAVRDADSIPEKLANADGVVLFVTQGARWVGSNQRRREAFREFEARGGGVTVLHWAVGAKEPQYIDFAKNLWGGVHGGTDRRYIVDQRELRPNPQHFITAGIEPFTIRDEWYHRLKFPTTGTLTPLFTVEIDGTDETVAWAWERPSNGRSFGFVGLHFHQNWEVEAYRQFVTRGVLWTVHREQNPGPLALNFGRQDLEMPRPKEDKQAK